MIFIIHFFRKGLADMASIDNESIIKSVPQKGSLVTREDYLHYFSPNFGSVSLTME